MVLDVNLRPPAHKHTHTYINSYTYTYTLFLSYSLSVPTNPIPLYLGVRQIFSKHLSEPSCHYCHCFWGYSSVLPLNVLVLVIERLLFYSSHFLAVVLSKSQQTSISIKILSNYKYLVLLARLPKLGASS